MESLIIKYLKGEASERELLEIEKWVNESSENRKEFARKVNLYAISANIDGKVNLQDFEKITQQVRRFEKRKRIVRFFAAAAVASALFIGAGLYSSYKIKKYTNDVAYILDQGNTTLEYSTPYGVKSRIMLPDSSIVWLNSGSRIFFPSKFHGKERLIAFSGEGFFEIKKDTMRPMKIETPDGLTVNVLGTKFNLNTYSEDKTLALLLLSGKVNIKMKSGYTYNDIKPSEKIIIDRRTSRQMVNVVNDTLPTTGWKIGWLVFDDLPLSEVFTMMKRWYGITIKVEDGSLLEKRLSAKFKEESASQVMDLMHKTQLINYSIQDSIAYVRNFSW